MQPNPISPPPVFKSLHLKDDKENQSIAELDRKAGELKEQADKLRFEKVQKEAQQLAQAKAEKHQQRDELKEELLNLVEASSLTGKLSADAALELVERKRELTKKIDQLEKELGFRDLAGYTPPVKKTFGLSSSKALWAIGALTLISFALFWLMGTAVIQDDPMNDSARRMMNSVGLRVITNFLPFSAVFLTAIGFIWLLFPNVFAYWHNKVATNLSLITDLEQCEPYQRVGFFAFSFGLPVWAFVELMQVIFG